MRYLSRSASREEVQAFTGLNNIQWASFLNITRDRAVSCVAAYPKTQWSKQKADTKLEIFNQVNEELVSEGIHRIDDSAIDWRMHQVVRDVLRKESSSTASKQTSRATNSRASATPPPIQAHTSSPKHEPPNPTPAGATSPDHTKDSPPGEASSMSRIYDPIQDKYR